ncbi:putative amidoligase enzyme-domain-containing protein [Talaromyces proteolyticus]|uniref:Amidoligase enzyme-domain-containing protein n=1 Tax=Talaromyces proteolyticus TaxID=1131652 RepID=A0AAD4KMJ3_9EURO|nr:putative amidoligase enzyme-domain-containing protein [Talaromyces proteolyticus]KAH8691937.1 putative amidoligase enzyme-domain-containing protein [Talaromyces proteolyticus]
MARRAPPPPPPPPPPPITSSAATKSRLTQIEAPTYPSGSYGIGVEVEFLLSPRQETKSNSIRDFSIKVASSYNTYLDQLAPGRHPRMHNAIDEAYLGPQFAEWSLDSDSTIEMPNKGHEPWGLESISPIFRAHNGSTWREHVEFMWRFLVTDFHISVNTSCGTHVHLSRVGGYSLADLKKICQSIIHFEPAFEAILPEERLGNEYARSNWLDNENFGHQNLSRKQSIAVINKVSSIRELVLLMNPHHDKMFGWNLLYLLNNPHGTIEFRRGAASASVQNVFAYIEIAMSFVEAAIRLGDPKTLQKVPSTVGGLRQFIQAANLPDGIPGLFDSRYLNLIFLGKLETAFREPKPLGNLSAYKLNKLKVKKEEDKKKNVAMIKMLREPYWS